MKCIMRNVRASRFYIYLACLIFNYGRLRAEWLRLKMKMRLVADYYTA